MRFARVGEPVSELTSALRFTNWICFAPHQDGCGWGGTTWAAEDRLQPGGFSRQAGKIGRRVSCHGSESGPVAGGTPPVWAEPRRARVGEAKTPGDTTESAVDFM